MADPNHRDRLPSRPPSQLALGWIGGGMAAGAVIVAGLLGIAVATAKDGFAAEWVLVPIFYGPPFIGVALIAIPGPSTRRSFGAGFMMGWGAALIVSSGLCVIGAIDTPFRIAG